MGFMKSTPLSVVIWKNTVAVMAWLFPHRPFPLRWFYYWQAEYLSPWGQDGRICYPRDRDDWAKAHDNWRREWWK